MNILVTLNENYFHPLLVMLKSLFLNNPNETFTIYLMHSKISQEKVNELDEFIQRHGSELQVIKISDHYFEDAPLLMHYTKEMYYRLLASQFLPKELERILYLDPDILVLNPVKDFYNLDLDGYLYAAASHHKVSLKEINRIRLIPYEIENYYNSGVLLLNLELQREVIDPEDIFTFVRKNRTRLIMPDQDILNALYSTKVKSVDEMLYNYDARFYGYYKLKTNGKCDMDFVINKTVFLHFCGKKKPWKKDYSGKFHSLYKHYEKLTFSNY